MQNLSPETWKEVVKVATLVLPYLGGKYSVPLINKIKGYLGWSGERVLWLTVGVSLLIGVLTAVVAGTIVPEPLTAASVAQMATIVLVFGHKEYMRIRNEQGG